MAEVSDLLAPGGQVRSECPVADKSTLGSGLPTLFGWRLRIRGLSDGSRIAVLGRVEALAPDHLGPPVRVDPDRCRAQVHLQLSRTVGDLDAEPPPGIPRGIPAPLRPGSTTRRIALRAAEGSRTLIAVHRLRPLPPPLVDQGHVEPGWLERRHPADRLPVQRQRRIPVTRVGAYAALLVEPVRFQPVRPVNTHRVSLP